MINDKVTRRSTLTINSKPIINLNNQEELIIMNNNSE